MPRYPEASHRASVPRGMGRVFLRRPARTRAGRSAERAFARGFSLLEVMIAIAIVGILAALAIPVLFTPLVRDQVVAAAPLADLAKKPIAAAWAATQSFPANNAAAGLPAAEKMVNNYVSGVAIRDGVIEITFGNSAHKEIHGKVLSIRPAVIADSPVIPVAWVCGHAAVPGGMTVRGRNTTNILTGLLPVNCQVPPKQP